MSEVINNRQQRIDTMKTLIRRLHAGSDEREIKESLDTLLGDAEYGDVFLMEMQLIQEGIPAEDIQRLCDTHTRVMRKHLDRESMAEQPPGHPVRTFVDENRELVRTTGEIRAMIRKLDPLPVEQDATPLMREIQRLLNDLMDVDKHYRRKENLLFPYFERNNLPGPPTVMWGKDDEVRGLLRQTLDRLQQMTGISVQEARDYCRLAVLPAADAVDAMVYKEEKILLPTALNLLTEQDWYDIHLQSGEYGYCLAVPSAEWVPQGGVHREIRTPEAEGGRIQMPTGSFTLEELMAAFGTMPFDLTFVDADDTVRYFSPGRDRVFDRSRAILGRKVQYCHPPKSVHIVNRIVQDFRSGVQDQAKFWINLRGRFIHICYYAMRNAEGKYLGTLEVTQDLTDLRALEGERRLLAYDGETRSAAGQPDGEAEPPAAPVHPVEPGEEDSTGGPDWISGEPQFVVDGMQMLRAGEVPLMRIHELLQSLGPARYILLVTDFEPTPMLDAMRKQGRTVYHTVHPDNPGRHLTYIR